MKTRHCSAATRALRKRTIWTFTLVATAAALFGIPAPAFGQMISDQGVTEPAVSDIFGGRANTTPTPTPMTAPTATGSAVANAMPITAAVQGNVGYGMAGQGGILPVEPDGAIPMGHTANPYVGVNAGCYSCGGDCPSGYDFRFDALYMDRETNNRFSLIERTFLDDFEMELSGRGTISRRFDCVDGYEVSWMGPIEWEESQTIIAPIGGRILTRLRPGLPVAEADLSTFGITPTPPTTFPDATTQFQSLKSRMMSFEANRTYSGWGVAKAVYGLRYVDFQEDIFYSSSNALNQVGFLATSVENIMVGPQVGMDITQPLNLWTWVDVRTRGALLANFAESGTAIVNNGSVIVNNADDDTDIAGFFEFGSYLRWQLGDSLSLHAGYEFWYLVNYAAASDQIFTTVTPSLGANANIDESTYFYGLSLGGTFSY